MNNIDKYFEMKVMGEQIVTSIVLMLLFGYIFILIVDEMMENKDITLWNYLVYATLMFITLLPTLYIFWYWAMRLIG